MSLSSICVPETFGSLALWGATILGVKTTVVSNYSASIPTLRHSPGQQFRNVSDVDFCNVTVSYTHPGQNDLISVETWLPPPDKWNERFLGAGGGGFVAGRDPQFSLYFMAAPLGDGFATATTDAGLLTPVVDWALLSKGNVNQIALHNFAARSLEEQGLIGRAVVKSAYGRDARYSYFQGCSQGGRQAATIAQRYPTLYNGIAANAPALSLAELFPACVWPPFYVSLAGGNAPHECEVDAITSAAVAACDGLDGVEDGIISVEAEECLARFDPFSVVGRRINCTARSHPDSGDVGQILAVSEIAAAVVNATWRGIRWADGRQTWFGLHPGTDLTGNQPYYLDPVAGSIFNTVCKSSGGTNGTSGAEEVCVARPNPLMLTWTQYFTARDPEAFSLSNTTYAEFDRLRRFGEQEYVAMTALNPDLSEFHKAGGKMLTYHGTHDNLIAHRGTERYYKSAAARAADIHEFYRYFPVPGLDHCFGGASSPPYTMLQQLQAWVENGTTPDSSPYELIVANGDIHQRLACPFPQKAAFSRACGDPAKQECWACAGDLAAAL